ncbi:uncharacterized protein [Palaemon carinicauda]|uniref:uncharacterized protein n=1 Tax=Palaemon carinicauda TaxID=392227 RepID=UPI0035B590B7
MFTTGEKRPAIDCTTCRLKPPHARYNIRLMSQQVPTGWRTCILLTTLTVSLPSVLFHQSQKVFVLCKFTFGGRKMPRTCVNRADNFCYICGGVTFASQKRRMTALVRKAYHLYFGCKIGDQDKNWAPHICCNTCATNLRQWLNRKRKGMPFAVPMTWREPTDHTINCYFCMVPPIQKGLSKKKKESIEYPNIPSAIRPIPHGEGLPVPDVPSSVSFE